MPNESLSQQIADLEEQRAHVNFLYENSTWASGPGFRARLSEIDGELAQLRQLAA